MSDRPERELVEEGRRYRVVEAWRSPTGWALGYGIALGETEAPQGQGEEDEGDDRRDRRFVLSPDRRLGTLEDEAVRELLSEGAALTVTERRFPDRDGRPWLAQNIGPVWSDGDVAAGLTGILFTSLAGPARRIETPGPHVGGMAAEELRRRLARALASREAGSGDEA